MLPNIIIFDCFDYLRLLGAEETPLIRSERAYLIALNRQLATSSLRHSRLVNATGSKGSSHLYDPIALALSP